MVTEEQKRRSIQASNIIAQQLGGFGRLQVMINAQNFMHDSSTLGSLSFQVKCRGAKFNYVKVTLMPSDTYTVKFTKVRGTEIKKELELTDIYAENLQEVVSDNLGLALSLGTMGR